MTTSNLYAVAAAIVFFWSGAVVSISFLEAWLKFTAPGVTLPIGLSIGRLVFSALNKMEWILLVGCMTCGLAALAGWWMGVIWLWMAAAVLTVETFWLLPALDARALVYMSGQDPKPSSVHLVFVAAEVIKVGCLVIGGIDLFKLI